MIGDYNIDMSSKSGERDKLEMAINQLGLQQLIKDHTYVSPNSKDSTIDLILTNSVHIVASGVSHVNISDHYPIYVTRDHIDIPKVPLSFMGRTYKHYVVDNYTMSGLKNINWNVFWDTQDPTMAWTILTENISFLLDFTCPIKTFTCKQIKKPWNTRELLYLYKSKDDARKKKGKQRIKMIKTMQTIWSICTKRRVLALKGGKKKK